MGLRFLCGGPELVAQKAAELWPLPLKVNFEAMPPSFPPRQLHKILMPHWPHECPQREQTQAEELLVASRENRAALLH